VRSVRRRHGAECRPDGVPAVCTDRRRDGRSVRDVRCGERAKYAADWMRCVRYRVCGHWRRVCEVCAWEAGECVEDDMRHVCFDLSGLCRVGRYVRCVWRRDCAECGLHGVPAVRADWCWDGRCLHDVCGGERAEFAADWMRCVRHRVCGHWRRVRTVRAWERAEWRPQCVHSVCIGFCGFRRDVRCVWRRDCAEWGSDGVPAVRAD
jgi:hypothetical protein